jgi:SAM-dependent methyltransferase
MADLSDPELVRREYATVDRLEARRLDRTGWLRGFEEVFVLLRAVAEVRPSRVLDAGCGTGGWTTLVAAPEVVGVDSSEAAVEAARARGADARLADIEELPFEDGSFDVVICNATLYHLRDLDAGLRELARVLRPGGRFVGGYTVPGHLDELWSVVGRRPTPDGANDFNGGTGDRHLARHFATVERREAAGEISWESRADLQQYLDAYLELLGPLDAPAGPYPFRATRRACIFVAEKSAASRIQP